MSESIFHKLFFYDCWSIAWRTISDASEPIPSKQDKAFYHVIDSGKTHWEADPFLFEKNGTIYLFFEYMPFHSHHGVIAYRTFQKDHFSEPVICLKTSSHLSYPDVFESDGKIYMIPESINDQSVCLFEAKTFPNQWELKKKLITGEYFVDSTVDQHTTKTNLYLYDPDEPNHKLEKLYLSNLDVKNGSLQKGKPVFTYSEKLGRPAGRLLTLSDKTVLRPTQDCRGIYGGSIRFMKCMEKSGSYHEEEFATLHVEDVKSNLKQNPLGIHTFNREGNLEVIDLFYSRFSLLKPIRGLLRKFK